MKLPISWLNDFTDVSDIDIKKYCDVMTATGSKVEGWESISSEIDNVVVGLICSVEKHPDADKLVICSVDVGNEEKIQIVTAAKNVYAGAYVPVAKAPSHLVGGVTIKKGKLRGVVSEGMFCSVAELGLTLHEMPYAVEDGILILNDDKTLGEYKPGDDIKKVLMLSDNVVEFEITPNRPDCLSVIGLARETGASFDKKVSYHIPSVSESGGNISELLDVEVKDFDLCPRYTARVVKNVRIAPSPLWMRMRLRAAGVRPINNIVDITNYVMLEYGQPMHAFDYGCLDGSKITVRKAYDGENFRSLDDVDHTLRDGMLVISDETKAVALAGVMGGANSEIKDSTTTVVFESACFMGSSVRITSRALGMRTESSGRFEKGLDRENTMPALERACELVELLDAGDVVSGVIDVRDDVPEKSIVKFNADEINRFLGTSIDEKIMRNILLSLDFSLENDVITVPSWRDDVRCMNDIAEEVIRIWGYDKIEATEFKAAVRPGSYTPRKAYSIRLSNLLCSLRCYETCTFSFISPKYYDKIRLDDDPRRNSVIISNPLGEDTSVMRTTLLPSVLECLARNNNYNNEGVSLYETAAVYIPNENKALQPSEPLQTAIATYAGDFYFIKAIVKAVLDDAGINDYEFVSNRNNRTFHPGRCADVKLSDGSIVASFGELHPEVCNNYGLTKKACAAVLDTEKLVKIADFSRKYVQLPKYPAVTRDFAFLCDANTEAGAIENVIRHAGGKLVEKIKLFDVYRDEKLGIDKKSLAFTVSLRADDRTLTDDEADDVTARILKYTEKELGIKIRS